jgi:DNA-binding NarL/FixJ family response regulator
MDKVRVVILEDHIATAEGYRARLAGETDIEIVSILTYGEELEPALEKTPADVLILDMRVPINAQIRDSFPIMHLLPVLLSRYPQLSILVISMYDRPAMIDAVLEAGAEGYVLKDDLEAYQELPMLIRMVARGNMYLSARVRENWSMYRQDDAHPDLSPRQVQALALCASYPNERLPELAHRMNLASATLRATLWGAYRKLGVNSRPAAVARARQMGLLPQEVDHFDGEF